MPQTRLQKLMPQDKASTSTKMPATMPDLPGPPVAKGSNKSAKAKKSTRATPANKNKPKSSKASASAKAKKSTSAAPRTKTNATSSKASASASAKAKKSTVATPPVIATTSVHDVNNHNSGGSAIQSVEDATIETSEARPLTRKHEIASRAINAIGATHRSVDWLVDTVMKHSIANERGLAEEDRPLVFQYYKEDFATYSRENPCYMDDYLYERKLDKVLAKQQGVRELLGGPELYFEAFIGVKRRHFYDLFCDSYDEPEARDHVKAALMELIGFRGLFAVKLYDRHEQEWKNRSHRRDSRKVGPSPLRHSWTPEDAEMEAALLAFGEAAAAEHAAELASRGLVDAWCVSPGESSDDGLVPRTTSPAPAQEYQPLSGTTTAPSSKPNDTGRSTTSFKLTPLPPNPFGKLGNWADEFDDEDDLENLQQAPKLTPLPPNPFGKLDDWADESEAWSEVDAAAVKSKSTQQASTQVSVTDEATESQNETSAVGIPVVDDTTPQDQSLDFTAARFTNSQDNSSAVGISGVDITTSQDQSLDRTATQPTDSQDKSSALYIPDLDQTNSQDMCLDSAAVHDTASQEITTGSAAIHCIDCPDQSSPVASVAAASPQGLFMDHTNVHEPDSRGISSGLTAAECTESQNEYSALGILGSIDFQNLSSEPASVHFTDPQHQFSSLNTMDSANSQNQSSVTTGIHSSESHDKLQALALQALAKQALALMGITDAHDESLPVTDHEPNYFLGQSAARSAIHGTESLDGLATPGDLDIGSTISQKLSPSPTSSHPIDSQDMPSPFTSPEFLKPDDQSDLGHTLQTNEDLSVTSLTSVQPRRRGIYREIPTAWVRLSELKSPEHSPGSPPNCRHCLLPSPPKERSASLGDMDTYTSQPDLSPIVRKRKRGLGLSSNPAEDDNHEDLAEDDSGRATKRKQTSSPILRKRKRSLSLSSNPTKDDNHKDLSKDNPHRGIKRSHTCSPIARKRKRSLSLSSGPTEDDSKGCQSEADSPPAIKRKTPSPVVHKRKRSSSLSPSTIGENDGNQSEPDSHRATKRKWTSSPIVRKRKRSLSLSSNPTEDDNDGHQSSEVDSGRPIKRKWTSSLLLSLLNEEEISRLLKASGVIKTEHADHPYDDSWYRNASRQAQDTEAPLSPATMRAWQTQGVNKRKPAYELSRTSKRPRIPG
ncbi:hypothetical protein QBC35DRAFT_454836 [Podospora australis]|uniref:Uncharacterized protein n=1 Tax=Podospora australis TaxID=1536484 RepID=A0AAN7AGF1_9PEZI|nr:hypothetical protein QBC35DRAFT_454836 [Podospora australis]